MQIEKTKECASTKDQKTALMYAEHLRNIHQRTDRMFAGLMLCQWLAAIAAALWLSPRTWSGTQSQIHIHVWAALLLGGSITLYPTFLAWRCPGSAWTRHVIAACQLLMSGLLIHLTGGRIETHFHVFGSLAFLAFYRDWRVLITGTVVTAADHLARGIFWSHSIYGIESRENWRWLEHAAWVLFEDGFLIVSCQWGLHELYSLCERDAKLEASNNELERKVEERTVSLQEANVRLAALATTDPLTGLPNHRALVDLLDKELERSHRYHRPCSLLFLDLDHFKALNDSGGHVIGDAVLQELGSVAADCLRGIDTLGRWGGEEFIVLLPETESQGALEIAERLRATISTHLFRAAGGLHLTCSVGIASYPDDATTRAELVDAADRAMYAAKRLGRNQVRVVTDPAVSTLPQGGDSSREAAALEGTVEALAILVEARDAYTGEHTNGVAELAIRIARHMGLNTQEVHLVGMVGKLHDIGKVAIPDVVLRKPGRLNEEEWALMRRHPEVGADIVSRIPSLRILAPGIRGHHERWDGKGYPDQLAGGNISLAARIVTVADSYGAITTSRPYRQARSHKEAMQELRRCAGTQFDPMIVKALGEVLAAEQQEAVLSLAA